MTEPITKRKRVGSGAAPVVTTAIVVLLEESTHSYVVYSTLPNCPGTAFVHSLLNEARNSPDQVATTAFVDALTDLIAGRPVYTVDHQTTYTDLLISYGKRLAAEIPKSSVQHWHLKNLLGFKNADGFSFKLDVISL